jgi:hypothetical protein
MFCKLLVADSIVWGFCRVVKWLSSLSLLAASLTAGAIAAPPLHKVMPSMLEHRLKKSDMLACKDALLRCLPDARIAGPRTPTAAGVDRVNNTFRMEVSHTWPHIPNGPRTWN